MPLQTASPTRQPHLRAALLGLVVAASAALLAGAACGGGGKADEGTASLIHRLLVAAAAEDASQLESFPGKLPEGLPIEPPLYPGAKIVVSSRSPVASADATTGASSQALLYFIVLDTPDSRTTVRSFYERELDEGQWQLESTASTEELDQLNFVDAEDSDIAGVVAVAAGGADGRTSILISLQDAGASAEDEVPFEPGEGLALPKEFPEQVPVYPDATVTGSAFYRDAGSKSFLVILLTRDDQEAVITYYKEQLEAAGLTTAAGQPQGLEERLQFNDAARDIQGDISADRSARSSDYTEVRIQVQVNATGTPSAGETPTPGEGGGEATPSP